MVFRKFERENRWMTYPQAVVGHDEGADIIGPDIPSYRIFRPSCFRLESPPFDELPVCLSLHSTGFQLTSGLVLMIPDQIYSTWLPFAKHKHVLKTVIVSLFIGVFDCVPQVDHCVVEIEANFLEIEGLSEASASFRSIECLILDNPDDDSAGLCHSKKLFGYRFKLKRVAFVRPKIVIGRRCQCQVNAIVGESLES
jgi:hypothetical protein